MICLIQHFEADFLWKVSLKILNSGIILKTFTHEQLYNSINHSGFNDVIVLPDQLQKPADLDLLCLVGWLVLLLYVPSQQLWSLQDGQFT